MFFLFLDDKGVLVLRKSADLGATFKTVAERIYSFGIGGRFLFASVMAGSGNVMPSASEVCEGAPEYVCLCAYMNAMC